MSSPPVIRPARRSLITIGLRESSTISSSSNPRANRQSSDPEIAQSSETNTSSSDYIAQPFPIESSPPLLEPPSHRRSLSPFSIENSSDSGTTSDDFLSLNGSNPLQNLPSNTQPTFSRRGSLVIQERQDLEWLALNPQQYNPTLKTPLVTKGFGNFKLEKEIDSDRKKPLRFPPLSNAAYDYLIRSDHIDRSKPACFNPQLDGAAFVKEYIERQKADEQRTGNYKVGPELPSPGNLVSRQTNWDHKLYDPEEGPCAYPPTSIHPFKSDFIEDVDKAVKLGAEPYEMCNKCGQRHIAWGPPISMQERDTCLSMLPEWFPKERFEHPWQTFIDLINDVVRYSERDQGRALNPDRKTWDKEWHEATAGWRAVGRYGGWWKCRTGLEDGQRNVPDLEKDCKVCHRDRTPEELELDQRIQRDEQKQTAAPRFIEHWIRRQLEKDKAIVKARFNSMGE